MNEDNKDFEYIINYFKKKNNKEQQEIYENMKKEHNLLHRLKIIASDKSEIEVIDLQLNIINNKIKTEQDKIKQDKIKHEEQKINEEKISLLKEKLQNYEYANNVLDNLIITSEELINKSEKILNRNATYQEEEELINQINENNSMIRKELNTPIISNLNSLDSLEKNINDTDLEIQNTIKQKLEDSSEKNKTTSPTITTESLYEEFKKRKQLREEKNSMKKNIYDEINKNDVNNTDMNIEYNKKIN